MIRMIRILLNIIEYYCDINKNKKYKLIFFIYIIIC